MSTDGLHHHFSTTLILILFSPIITRTDIFTFNKSKTNRSATVRYLMYSL